VASVAPLAVASGGHQGHRVNPGGNRRLNRALPGIAWCQRRCDEPARTDDTKKRTEGKTGRAAMRCPKRRLADVVYRLLVRGDTARRGNRQVLAGCG
jgi:transposase